MSDYWVEGQGLKWGVLSPLILMTMVMQLASIKVKIEGERENQLVWGRKKMVHSL